MKGYGARRSKIGGYSVSRAATPKSRHEDRQLDPVQKKIDKKKARRAGRKDIDAGAC